MNKNEPDPVPALPVALRNSFWSAHRRRPAFLLLLAVGLLASLFWLPGSVWTAIGMLLTVHRGLVVLLALFALVTLSLVWSAGQRLDIWIFFFFNLRGYHAKWLDRVMWFATQAGNILTAILLAGLYFVFNNRDVSVEIIWGTLTLLLLVETIKALTDRARPFHALEATRIIGWRERGLSFPSGHTAQSFFLITLLCHRFPFSVGATIALYTFAALVGFTRIYVGAHYPRDVIGGAVLGTVWGMLAALVDPNWFGLTFS
jgi:membrane-associated phospholipid phosphatase